MKKSEAKDDPLKDLEKRLCDRFGEEVGFEIMDIIYQELAGLRLSIPSIEKIGVQKRNRRIKKMFTGFNYEDLSGIFGLSVRHLRRIVNKKLP